MTSTEIPNVVLVFTGTEFWLRVEKPIGTHIIELKDNTVLNSARKSARDLGFEPAGWLNEKGRFSKFYTP